jgi:hypothetical protein
MKTSATTAIHELVVSSITPRLGDGNTWAISGSLIAATVRHSGSTSSSSLRAPP